MSNYNKVMRQGNAIALLSRITEKAHRLIIQELEAHGIDGIVPSHGSILVHLLTGEKYTMKDLAEKIHRTKPTVTVLVDKLVNLGYVTKEKSNEDSRVTFIKLTEKGLGLRTSFNAISEKLNAVVYKDLADEEAEYFEATLRKINQNLD
ncbi:MarR family winged helix-turn-helix transcriptional regulator [Pelosinus sp. UFO1]|uniref:MarR family winged helix-turn-helix transcriptional regulator n=1 Tax=Pelosinus sp. UFO1 TaxID=484770 RepID=UPI0004D1C1AF|nr:MarR family winged helix-turn-helix transcriptional regulator [Pelosinus sp. UFO1]AIF53097.1 transcriptional regulator, MarR family [Pelosinus sp. UFO1]